MDLQLLVLCAAFECCLLAFLEKSTVARVQGYSFKDHVAKLVVSQELSYPRPLSATMESGTMEICSPRIVSLRAFRSPKFASTGTRVRSFCPERPRSKSAHHLMPGKRFFPDLFSYCPGRLQRWRLRVFPG